jgi:hypothetical protein
LAKVDARVLDVEAFARYSYQDNVPFLARNFGTFGVHFGYDLFDAGRKRALLREREAQVSQAKENLARLTDQVKLAVHTAHNKLERTSCVLNAKVPESADALDGNDRARRPASSSAGGARSDLQRHRRTLPGTVLRD